MLKLADETFVEFKDTTGQIVARAQTGSISIEYRYIVYRNDRGEITDIKPKIHYVCCGADYCYECGRKMEG